MTPDELRALADALDHMIPMTWPEKMHDMAALIQAVAYLRACADVQPVRAVPIGHALSAVRHVGSANYPDRERAAIERLYSAEFDAYAHPAPAAPQAEPKRNQPLLDLLAVIHCDGGDHTEAVGIEQSIKDALSAVCVLKGKLAQAEPSAALIRAYNSGYMQGHHDTVEAQFIDIHPLDMDTYHADVVAELGLTAAPQAEPIDPHMIVADDRFPDAQAEPKREPACLWSRADDDTDVWETGCGHAFTIIDGTPGDTYMEFCCYCGRPLEQEIGGSDE